MNSLLLRTLAVPKSPSLQTFTEYRQSEANNTRHSSVSVDGALLEYETLELRVHPPNVEVDNDQYEDRSVITVDSANRPGTLVEVVQCITELGLNVKKARISSDGGWFVDEFHVTDAGRKLHSERKLKAIRQVLSVEIETEAESEVGTDQHDESKQCSTVFELAGSDKVGLLADVTHLLTQNGCEVRSAAVWTYNSRVAFVVSVLEKNQPVKDRIKLERLHQLLAEKMDARGDCIVNVSTVKGQIHYERRLHQLLLKEEEKGWQRMHGSGVFDQSVTTEPATPSATFGKNSKPEVVVQHYKHLNYWLVTVRCNDRHKLLFDTVCTLSDLNYDVYHSCVDCENDVATMLFYIRPRFGDFYWDSKKAARLKYMLEGAIQRRFPKGMKVHVQTVDHHSLAQLTQAWKEHSLWITRAKVRAYAASGGHTFYVMDASGGPPDVKRVQAACSQVGGKLHQAGQVDNSPTPLVLSGGYNFLYSIGVMQKNWDGSPGSLPSV